MLRTASIAAAFAFIATSAMAALDLSAASVERLENGLTLILLEDHTFPVVSVQTVYRTGAKDDPAGRLGLAHFFEHMAFRGSKNFPDTGLVSSIYAAGGEWHGYTWIDLTTYFATAPKAQLPLLLDIEADRMARLDVSKADVEAERGAVLAEMNGYLNDPDTTLFDTLIATHFLTHPYRNNTIGYAGDVNAITHDDLVAFYQRHYAPQNAVIAIAGDFDRDVIRAAVKKKFGKIRKPVVPRDPLTAETPRTGERRIRLSLPSDSKLFKIAYSAPASSSADFPAFLVLQALIGESNGVNFNQNDWGTAVGAASPLAPLADNIRTWIIPTAEPYAFVISGSAPPKGVESKIEDGVQKTFDALTAGKVDDDALNAAKAQLQAALAYDVETTEDAAHQLAYFASIGASDRLLSLSADIDQVTAKHIAAIAKTYLRKDARTIAWLTPGAQPLSPAPSAKTPAVARGGSTAPQTALPAPVDATTPAGGNLLFQQSPLSPTLVIEAVVNGRYDCSLCAVDSPAFGLTSIAARGTSRNAKEPFASVAAAIASATPLPTTPPASDDPLTRLEEIFSASVTAPDAAKSPIVVVVSGDADFDRVETLAAAFGDFSSQAPQSAVISTPAEDVEIMIPLPKAQAAVGFLAKAPAANDPDALAMKIALYVLSHGYEGRLGKEAISRRGLAYYIDAEYRAGLGGGLVTLATGVDPEKVDAFSALMKSEIARLQSAPPSDAEIAEAKRNLIGRKISAAQSNGEIAGALIRDFLATGGAETTDAFAARVNAVSRENVVNAVSALQKGAVVTIRVGGVD